MRNVQHKKEAYWFYRFLSIFYDSYVNPFFWTKGMRKQALQLGDFNRRNLTVADVGSGTGFTTQGIAEQIDPQYINCIDQSPHQMAYAQGKPDLQGAHFQTGDAEDLPFASDSFDRYVSAGSIEYWPEPLRGIAESYRILKPGGKALMIGPLRPRNAIARFLADTWMLFPEEEDYRRWYQQAGFSDITSCYLAPKWVFKEKYGIAVVGTKPQAGTSPANLPERKTEDVRDNMSPARRLRFFARLLIGNLAGFFFIPMALAGYVVYGIRRLSGTIPPEKAAVQSDRLTPQQRLALAALTFLVAMVVFY